MRPDGVGPSITVSGDKRVTRVGRYLRASKLDEFPQLWNVLIGEMSLVGPRPEVPEYVELFRLRYEHILSVRPGITDLASIRFRGEERILAASQDPLQEYVKAILPQKLTLAEEYIRRRSVWLDLWILLKTVSIVFWPDPVS
jgi:lipopolysaccharide/colanic/teichoic acid biosynthesis glycosyltransferase